MRLDKLESTFLKYLVENQVVCGDPLPTLAAISDELGVSVGKLREEVSYARAAELISIKPRVGMRREPFDFLPIVLPSILFALASGDATFEQFSQLRRAIEASLWPVAVPLLEPDDIARLRALIAEGWAKLRANPITIPHSEHRAFHLGIFSRLDNPFVRGLLEAYWEVYAASEFNRYQTYAYWDAVWSYHEQIVDALAAGDAETGLRLLVEHFGLLKIHNHQPISNGH